MITVLDYFKEAEFALASYANLFAGVAGDQLITALEDGGKGMSAVQAAAFASKWKVVDQYTWDQRGQLRISF
ncbi:MAG: hypothetical protein ACYCZT_13895 [Thiobacillus sp.]